MREREEEGRGTQEKERSGTNDNKVNNENEITPAWIETMVCLQIGPVHYDNNLNLSPLNRQAESCLDKNL